MPSATEAKVRVEKEKPLEASVCAGGSVEGPASDEIDDIGLALERAIDER